MERFVLQTTASEIESIFSVKVTSESLINSTFNAAPGHLLPAIFQKSGNTTIEWCIWNPNMPSVELNQLIPQKNTLLKMLTFQCIIPISGFYIWKKTIHDPLPFYVRIHSQNILGIPGYISSTGTSRLKFTVFTRNANVLLKPLDKIMPCILKTNHIASWLQSDAYHIASEGFRTNDFIPDMTVYRVPHLVNDLANNNSDLIQPIPKIKEFE